MTLWVDNLLLTVGLEPYMLKLSHQLRITKGAYQKPAWRVHGVSIWYIHVWWSGDEAVGRVRGDVDGW